MGGRKVAISYECTWCTTEEPATDGIVSELPEGWRWLESSDEYLCNSCCVARSDALMNAKRDRRAEVTPHKGTGE